MKPLTLKKNPKPGRCSVMRCNNKCKGRAKMCNTCRSRKCRQGDPVRYAYNNLIAHAKERGILCTITLDEFREFCHKVKYIGFTGRSAESYTIDRRHCDIGYHIDNIQVMANSNNVKKFFTYDWRTKTVVAWANNQHTNQNQDLPF
jgi:adenine specific DNA methylase Mod